jgi:polyisoprenoid-binding protein YceI
MTTNWNLDAMHSEVAFKVRHMMISNVSGTFNHVEASMTSNSADLSDAQFTFSASVDSIDTGVADRDGHLKSEDFFNAAAFPTISFASTAIELNGKSGHLNGTMRIKDTTLPIALNIELSEVVVDPYGQTKVGISATGSLSRKDYGLTWSAVTEAGHIVVGDEIKLAVELQFIKQN